MRVHVPLRASISPSRAGRELAVLGALVLLAGACSKGDAGRRDTAAAPATATSTAAAAAPAASAASSQPSDANILAMEEGSDSSEIEVARLAQQKATDPAVKAYAALLVQDHGKSLRDLKALATKTSITPQPPPGDTTAQQTTHLKERFSGLAKGAAFDTAFVNHEVEDHHHDIDEAHRMESAAQNADVKAEVRKSLPTLEKHLQRAEQLAARGKSK